MNERDYVIVCNRHKGIDGSLLFWGDLTSDEEERSFGGYTSNLNECEKYTLEELKQSSYNFPVYGQGVDWKNFRKCEDVAIKITELTKLGYRPMLIYYR